MGAGKSTVCQAAIDAIPGYERIGFSDPLYHIMLAMGIPESIVYDKERWNEPLEAFGGRTARYICQSVGTWGRNEIDVNLWARATINRTKRNSGVTVIDNVRRINEADAVIDAGGVIVAFDRVGLTADLSHESEKEIPFIQRNMCETTFINNGENLRLAAKQFRDILKWLAAPGK